MFARPFILSTKAKALKEFSSAEEIKTKECQLDQGYRHRPLKEFSSAEEIKTCKSQDLADNISSTALNEYSSAEEIKT